LGRNSTGSSDNFLAASVGNNPDIAVETLAALLGASSGGLHSRGGLPAGHSALAGFGGGLTSNTMSSGSSCAGLLGSQSGLAGMRSGLGGVSAESLAALLAGGGTTPAAFDSSSSSNNIRAQLQNLRQAQARHQELLEQSAAAALLFNSCQAAPADRFLSVPAAAQASADS
jgi:hypothetical protein